MNFTCFFVSLSLFSFYSSQSPVHEEPAHRILKEVDFLTQKWVNDNVDSKKMRILLSQLHERISTIEQIYRNRITSMQSAQDNSFAELCLDKNEEITKLARELESLKLKKKKSDENITKKFSDELLLAKNDAAHLKELLKNRNDEIKDLTYKLIDSQSYANSLEKKKRLSTDCSDEERILRNFKTIRQALSNDQNILKIMQAKTVNKAN